MRGLVLISAICMQLCWCYGLPASHGAGAFAYQDSTGNRYGGTYGLKDGQAYNLKRTDDFTTFGPDPYFQDFQDLDSFFPEYFRNFENLLKEAFAKNLEQQKLALGAARKAFDLTSNQAGYIPNFGFDSRFQGVPNFGFPSYDFGMPNYGANPYMQGFHQNSAFAGGAVGPGYRHQMVNINPINPQMPNVDVSQMSDPTITSRNGNPGQGQFYSVSSSSFASSANKDGQEQSYRGGETVVNDNGKITKYSVHS